MLFVHFLQISLAFYFSEHYNKFSKLFISNSQSGGKLMKTIADLHMHTNVSQHAYSTLNEMALAAKEKGLLAFGITNHGPEMMDGAIAHHFLCMKGLPKQIHGLRFFAGAEVNIKSYEGRIDLPPAILESLDFVVASYHVEAISPSSLEDHTAGLLNIIENPSIDCLGHIGNPVFRCDYEAVVKACAKHHKLIEINSNSFSVRPGSHENCLETARLCKMHQVQVIISSDAHSCYSVGDHGAAVEMLESIGFPEELVVNSSWERLKEWFEI